MAWTSGELRTNKNGDGDDDDDDGNNIIITIIIIIIIIIVVRVTTHVPEQFDHLEIVGLLHPY